MQGSRTLFVVLLTVTMMVQGTMLTVRGDDELLDGQPSRAVNTDFILAGGVEITSTEEVGRNSSYFYPVPDHATVLSANMEISVHPFTEGGNDYPKDTWFNIAEGKREYQFKNEEEDSFQGNWGYNYETIHGDREKLFTDDITLTFSLPLNASVKSAKLNITGFQRDQEIIEMNLSGSSLNDRYAYTIRSLGDVNNDGDHELLVSAPGEMQRTGMVYYANSSMISDNITHGRFASGTETGEGFGHSISGIFGYSDSANDVVAVGSPFYGIDNRGSITIFTFFPRQSGLKNFAITGNNSNSKFGASVEALDFNNNDSYELFIGAPNDNGGNGAVYIYSVSSREATLITVINGSSGENHFGKDLAVGDMNDDGIDDIMISSDEYVHLFLGSNSIDLSADAVYDPISDSGLTASEIGPIRFLGKTGTSLNTFAAGIPTQASGNVVLYDSGSDIDPNRYDLMSPTVSIPYFGYSIASGDMDQDGLNEIAIGAPGTDTSIGTVQVFKRGQTNPWKNMPVLGNNGDRFGFSVEIADTIMMGDDDFQDVIVGAPQFMDTTATGAGKLYRFDYYDLDRLTDNKPTANVEGVTSWTYSQDRLAGKITSGDMSTHINNYLSTAGAKYDSNHESFVWVNITILSAAANDFENSATFLLDDFEIIYDETIAMEDLASEFNHYMRDETRVKEQIDGETIVMVPFVFFSQSPGRIRIESIDVEYDEIPFIENEPVDIRIPEDTINEELLDLYQVFSDDNTGNPYLNYSVTPTGTNRSIADMYIKNNRYLAVDLTNSTDDDGDGFGDFLNWSGQIEFFFTVIDELGGKFISHIFILHVDDVNDPPAVTNLPNTFVTQDELFTYSPSAVDDENDEINYSLDYSNSPENMTIDHMLGTVKWTPNMWEVGDTNFTLVLRDDQDERVYNFPLTVLDEPDPPIFLTPPPEAPDGVMIETTFEYKFTAVDPDIGDRVTYSIINPPQGAGIDSQTGFFTWTPPQHYNEPVQFTIRALDRDGNIAELIFELNTTFEDTKPRLIGEPERILYDAQQWTFNVNIVDEEDHGIKIDIVEKPEGMEYDIITQDLTWTPTVKQIGKFNLSIRIISTSFDFYINYTLEVLRSEREWTVTIEGIETGQTVKGKIVIGGDLRASPSNVREVQVKVGDNNWTTGSIADGRWSYTIDTTKYEDGSYTILIRGFDGAIYSDTESVSIMIKNQKETTSPLIFILFAVMIMFLIGAGVGVFLLIKKQKEKKEREEIEKRQREAIEESKKSMDDFLKETGSDLDENIDYASIEVHDESTSDEEFEHIDEIFQPLNIPKSKEQNDEVSIPEDPLTKADTSQGPVMGESMKMESIEEVPSSNISQEPPLSEPPEQENSKEDSQYMD